MAANRANRWRQVEKLTEFSLLAHAKCVADEVDADDDADDEAAAEDDDDEEEVVCSINEDKSSETELHLVS